MDPMTDFDLPDNRLTRRDALRLGAAGAAALALAGSERAEALFGDSPYGPFYMGIQSYSLRAFNLDKALDMTYKLGLRYWEAFPAHIPQTDSPADVQKTLAKLKAAKIRLHAYGVVGFDANEAAARKTFAFARAMGIRVISA